jgi:outer membrane protein OmpA-like peptidoglycan-associated protein
MTHCTSLKFCLSTLLFGCIYCLQFPAIYAQKKLKNPPVQKEVRIQNARRLNSEGYDFAPVKYRNGLVFVTSRRKSGPQDTQTGETFFELWYSELDPNQQPLEPNLFSIQLKSQFHENAVAFSRDENKIYYTRNSTEVSNQNGRKVLNIFEATRNQETWTDQHPLPFNGKDYSCMHPTLTPDGNKMIFASNMPGGMGGLDLYLIEKKEDQWTVPINLGPEVNTPGNEVFPFFHESGTLFFSSDGHRGLGGFDLFMIDLSGPKWGAVANLGIPFNSEQDDLTFYLNSESNSGFFASGRTGGKGKDDIYSFEAPLGIQGIEVPELRRIIVKIADDAFGKKADGAAIRVFNLTDKESKDLESLYQADWVPDSKMPGVLTLQLSTKQLEDLPPPDYLTAINGIVTLDLEANKNFLLHISKPGFETKEITVNTNELHPDPIYVFLEPVQCITYSGKTISENSERGIPFAEINLRNENTGETTLQYANQYGHFTFCLEPNSQYTLIGEKIGYNTGLSSISTIEASNLATLEGTLRLSANNSSFSNAPGIRLGSILILEDISYDFNKSPIRVGEGREFKELGHLLIQYPTMEVEMNFHTDTRGQENYNLQLSENRAQSAKRQLEQMGIPSYRITTVAKGESQPRNHCKNGVNCDEKGHLFNQRVEVVIKKLQESIPYQFSSKGLIFNK